jgi:hypothetical protein
VYVVAFTSAVVKQARRVGILGVSVNEISLGKDGWVRGSDKLLGSQCRLSRTQFDSHI